ncbi:MAG TPA: HD domain-containing phosphohydrolase [Acidobacteriaceae bacterium]|jgi:putative nucleotidyltransferase with HDIG domain
MDIPVPSHQHPVAGAGAEVPASEVIAALSYALDLTEGQPMGHSLQSCLIGMRLGNELKLPRAVMADLYYALLLKDAGCSSNSSKLFHIIHSDEIKAKGDLKDKDWSRVGWESFRYAVDHVAVGKPFLQRVRTLISVAITQQNDSRDLVQIRCERGATIARRIGFSMDVAAAIANLDEHWDGSGYPAGLKGEAIPLLARIMNLSQTLAVFWTLGGPLAAEDVMEQRSARWFDPELVRAARALSANGSLWLGLDNVSMDEVTGMEPEGERLILGAEAFDDICLAFADVIDAKSPFTYRHSQGVADAAVKIAAQLDFPMDEIRSLRRAALLHDIGKLAVPNSILEKPGKLDAQEWDVVKRHPFHTLQVLKRVPGFHDLSEIAAAHHEKLDGSGYFRHWGAEQLNTQARILTVADIFDALAASRPYREALPLEKVFSIMRAEAPHALDVTCLEALIYATQTSAVETPAAEPMTLRPTAIPNTAPLAAAS